MMCKSILVLLPVYLRYLSLCGSFLIIVSFPFVGYAGDLLSDDELAIISAGAPGPRPDPTGDQPGVADDLTVVGDPVVENWGAVDYQGNVARDINASAIHENIIIEAGSSASIKRSHQINLSYASQFNITALNLSNTVQSNVINGVNLNSNNQTAQTLQNNWFEQNDFQQVRHAINDDFVLIRNVSLRDERITNVINLDTSEIHNDVMSRNVVSYSHVEATIEPFKPEVLFDIGNIQASTPARLNLIAPVHRSFSAADSDGSSWSLYGSYSGLSLTPVFRVNGLEPRGEDLFLDIELGIPGVDMGTISAGGCISSCGKDSTVEFFSVDLGGIERTNIIDGITFREMNPLNGLELNINSGIAYSGQGRFSASDASVGISGEVTAHIGANLDFYLDLSDNWWVDNLFSNNGVWDVHKELDYEVSIPFTILEYQVDPFDVVVNGSVCMDLGSLFECGNEVQEYKSQVILYMDNSSFYSQTEEIISSNAISESNSYEEMHGGILTGAQAELIIMTASDLELATDSGVNINDNAQQNMEAVNVVNSASAISANSLNMDVTRQGLGNMSRASRGLLNQQNYFNQRL